MIGTGIGLYDDAVAGVWCADRDEQEPVTRDHRRGAGRDAPHDGRERARVGVEHGGGGQLVDAVGHLQRDARLRPGEGAVDDAGGEERGRQVR